MCEREREILDRDQVGKERGRKELTAVVLVTVTSSRVRRESVSFAPSPPPLLLLLLLLPFSSLSSLSSPPLPPSGGSGAALTERRTREGRTEKERGIHSSLSKEREGEGEEREGDREGEREE